LLPQSLDLSTLMLYLNLLGGDLGLRLSLGLLVMLQTSAYRIATGSTNTRADQRPGDGMPDCRADDCTAASAEQCTDTSSLLRCGETLALATHEHQQADKRGAQCFNPMPHTVASHVAEELDRHPPNSSHQPMFRLVRRYLRDRVKTIQFFRLNTCLQGYAHCHLCRPVTLFSGDFERHLIKGVGIPMLWQTMPAVPALIFVLLFWRGWHVATNQSTEQLLDELTVSNSNSNSPRCGQMEYPRP
jgi:hypothetical protein